MRIVLNEWLKDKVACLILMVWALFKVINITLNNSIVLLISKTLSEPERWRHNIIILLIILVINMIISSSTGYLKVASRLKIINTLMDRYADKLIDADYDMFTKFSVAKVATIQQFIEKVPGIGTDTVNLLLEVYEIIITMYTMYKVADGNMVIPIIVIYIIGFIFLKRIFKMYASIEQDAKTMKVSRNQEIENIITGFAEVRSFNTGKFHRDSIYDKNKNIHTKILSKGKINSILYATIESLDSSGLIVVILFTIKNLINGLITQAQAMSLIMFVRNLINPLLYILNYMDELSDRLSLAKDYNEIINYKNSQNDGNITLDDFNDCISIENLSFSYNDSKSTLNDINMVIKKGQKVGICGTSGGGKSTLFKLITRFYDSNNGVIKIDGMNIKDITLDSYRKFIGSVHQENTIFPGSIKENIMYGSQYATENELIDACRKANILDFILSLDKKFETEVGPRGLKLSGGQKQRIALARIFLKNSEIILLDEATSALDNESETFIQDAIDKLSDKTIITIAHRLSTIKNCDIIYVFGNNGHIVEQGSHEELIEKKGVYFSMLK